MMAGEDRKERRILVAVDESEESMYALSWCLTNVISDNPETVSRDTLILLYAKPRPGVYTAMDGTVSQRNGILLGGFLLTALLAGYLFSSDIMATTERWNNRVADSVMEKTRRMCREFGDVKVDARVENGEARDVICRMAEKLGPDVLVMGSHGYGLIKRALLGSVSNHCAQNVKCPVLVVKKPKSSVLI